MPDMIDLSTVRILNSPDIHAWPATTAITRLELRPSGVHVEFTKQRGPDRWPDVPFGDPVDQGALQFTLWIVLQLGFQWYAAGCIEFWFGLEESGGAPQDYAAHWYYDANRWGPMTGHQPAVGERVGFLITSGDARHGDEAVGLHERSQVVLIDFPSAAGGVFTFDAVEPPGPCATDDAVTQLFGELLADADRLVTGVAVLSHAIGQLDARLVALQANGVTVHR
jgi:hypothetical protein